MKALRSVNEAVVCQVRHARTHTHARPGLHMAKSALIPGTGRLRQSEEGATLPPQPAKKKDNYFGRKHHRRMTKAKEEMRFSCRNSFFYIHKIFKKYIYIYI